tara:strand:- start:90 stop:545 length:456 start_codon:yes stop_codon:yes gene_type:complete
MANTVRTYDNNQVIVDKLAQLRTCIDRRHHALYKKIVGGLACDTGENVKLSLIAYLLGDYQVNSEDLKDTEHCLQETLSTRTGWKIINVFLDYVERECRDCLQTGAAVTVGNAGTPSTPPTVTYMFVTQSGNTLVHPQTIDGVTGNTIKKY